MKRLFDFTVSLLLILMLLPIFFIIGIVIAIDAGNPVIYKQYRVGKDNKLFYIYKFRTMKNNTRLAATKDLTEADSVITKSGRILRKTSLDELPQLFNVLKGDMSFVGPRPLIPEEKEIRLLRKEYGIYTVRPGITGWAQVNGRDMLTDEEKALFDKEYIDKQSIAFDIKIMFKTVLVVLKRENISEGSEPDNKYNSGNS
ncbi:MAG: sugar transferase [Ruminococcaceae bacterium]|nr:sugar transferase [Oscillospiraceae bacterium]